MNCRSAFIWAERIFIFHCLFWFLVSRDDNLSVELTHRSFVVKMFHDYLEVHAMDWNKTSSVYNQFWPCLRYIENVLRFLVSCFLLQGCTYLNIENAIHLVDIPEKKKKKKKKKGVLIVISQEALWLQAKLQMTKQADLYGYRPHVQNMTD